MTAVPAPPVPPCPSCLEDPEDFVRRNTRFMRAPLVPEVQLLLAHEMLPLWRLTEEELSASGLEPPFWAFAWAGGQALARYVLDNPGLAAGRRVLDFGAGSGLVAIAAALAGARVEAVDVDPLAVAACRLNAAANGVPIEVSVADPLGAAPGAWDLILCGDVFYEQPLAGRLEAWLRRHAASGGEAIVGDPGRTYVPRHGLEALQTYRVTTSRELEDNAVRRTTVWRIVGNPAGGRAP